MYYYVVERQVYNYFDVKLTFSYELQHGLNIVNLISFGGTHASNSYFLTTMGDYLGLSESDHSGELTVN